MTYHAWTAKDVEHRILEAAETLMLMPGVKGPKAYGSAMPDYVRDWQAYGSEQSRYKRRPSRDAISRMPETWGWINTLLKESDRKLIYAWAWVKVRRGVAVNDFASREGMNSRTLRRTITRLCQRMANDLNRTVRVRFTPPMDGVSEIGLEADPNAVSSVNYASHWMAPDAKPQHLPERLEPVHRNPAESGRGENRQNLSRKK
ncbi:DUF6362 family protein [Mesorhizobium sp. Z1-4]|uniref:DUF6362 family protein n=1 Tax=Mesorhizobium sp. Z1-4 TaxID=2448478 RepID=UPI000FDC6A1E|nr:DUF6362 family protein [Mesorhizobium sp. Z1-4]